jgi:antitoxin VapB
MAEASLFKSNRSQAVRLPKQFAFPGGVKKVEIFRSGDSLIIVPAGRRWADFFERFSVSDDFLEERNQPPLPEREPL